MKVSELSRMDQVDVFVYYQEHGDVEAMDARAEELVAGLPKQEIGRGICLQTGIRDIQWRMWPRDATRARAALSSEECFTVELKDVRKRRRHRVRI
jgi:hypothetical protein